MAVSSPRVRIKLEGDRDAAAKLLPYAFSQRAIMHNLMDLGNHVQGQRAMPPLEDGSIVVCTSVYGDDVIRIYTPLKVETSIEPLGENQEVIVIKMVYGVIYLFAVIKISDLTALTAEKIRVYNGYASLFEDGIPEIRASLDKYDSAGALFGLVMYPDEGVSVAFPRYDSESWSVDTAGMYAAAGAAHNVVLASGFCDETGVTGADKGYKNKWNGDLGCDSVDQYGTIILHSVSPARCISLGEALWAECPPDDPLTIGYDENQACRAEINNGPPIAIQGSNVENLTSELVTDNGAPSWGAFSVSASIKYLANHNYTDTCDYFWTAYNGCAGWCVTREPDTGDRVVATIYERYYGATKLVSGGEENFIYLWLKGMDIEGWLGSGYYDEGALTSDASVVLDYRVKTLTENLSPDTMVAPWGDNAAFATNGIENYTELVPVDAIYPPGTPLGERYRTGGVSADLEYYLQATMQVLKFTAGRHRFITNHFPAAVDMYIFELFYGTGTDKLSEMTEIDTDLIVEALYSTLEAGTGLSRSDFYPPIMYVDQIYVLK